MAANNKSNHNMTNSNVTCAWRQLPTGPSWPILRRTRRTWTIASSGGTGCDQRRFWKNRSILNTILFGSFDQIELLLNTHPLVSPWGNEYGCYSARAGRAKTAICKSDRLGAPRRSYEEQLKERSKSSCPALSRKQKQRSNHAISVSSSGCRIVLRHGKLAGLPTKHEPAPARSAHKQKQALSNASRLQIEYTPHQPSTTLNPFQPAQPINAQEHVNLSVSSVQTLASIISSLRRLP